MGRPRSILGMLGAAASEFKFQVPRFPHDNVQGLPHVDFDHSYDARGVPLLL